MDSIHQKLKARSKHYSQWHQQPYYQHHHWLVFVLAFFVGVFAIASTWQVSLDEHDQIFQSESQVQAQTLTSFRSFGSVLVTPDFNVSGSGTNYDSIAFYEDQDPTQSLMFVTAKDDRLVEVWQYPFNSAQTDLTHTCINSRTNGVVVDQEADLLYVSLIGNGRVCVFNLPSLTLDMIINSSGNANEPGIGLLKLANNQKRLYISDGGGTGGGDRVLILDATTGSQIGQFSTIQGLEVIAGDSFNQVIYMPVEISSIGVNVYDPDGRGLGNFGEVFDSDEEGIALYTCPEDGLSDNGEGLIIVVDQKQLQTTDFGVIDRKTKEYLGLIQISGVTDTDGIASTQQSSAQFPKGILAAINSNSATAGVGWDRIFSSIGPDFGCPGGIITPPPPPA